MGLSRGWKKMYCALLPFSPRVGAEVTELQLLFIDEQALSLVDKIWVSESRSETCPTRARLHVDLVSPILYCSLIPKPVTKPVTQPVTQPDIHLSPRMSPNLTFTYRHACHHLNCHHLISALCRHTLVTTPLSSQCCYHIVVTALLSPILSPTLSLHSCHHTKDAVTR